MRNRLYILIFLFFPTCVIAQDASQLQQTYLQAEEEYNNGRFDKSILLLNKHLDYFTGTLKSSAYRLIALCYLEQDNKAQAERNVSMLLKFDPYYSVSIHDPLRFVDMVTKMKKGEATITTASQQSENLNEVPVPVTLITEKMIKTIGAKTLKDVLLAYVPGMNDVVSANEVNVAMRGIYTSGQQKILILLNGHRMNSRTYNGANPDFSISLPKIKQIEVLRGPASSLYGNVALTAVINIITKSGRDIDGIQAGLLAGSNDEYGADLLFGKHYLNSDFTLWASVYKADGENYFIERRKALGDFPKDGYAILGGYRDKPSYDYGFTFSWNNLSFLFNQRYSKMIEPFNSLGNMLVNPGGVHDYKKYRLWDGKEGPGAGFNFTHSEIKYSKETGKWGYDVTTYLDFNKNSLYTALADTANLPENSLQNILQKSGPWQILKWDEYSLGLSAKSIFSYGTEKRNSGNLTFGFQVEYMNLYSQLRCNGYNYQEIVSVDDFIALGGETTYSAFVQNKHYISSSWIMNTGLRLDFKDRKSGKWVKALSPRMALIYVHPSKTYNAKLSYSHSFVDAPYFYRYNYGIVSFTGGENLSPEHLDSWQLTLGYTPKPSFNFELNTFYNNLSDFIYNDKTADIGQLESPFKNAGMMKTIGIEGSSSITVPRASLNFNFTWQHVLSGKNYSFRGSRIYNIPPFTSNLTINYKLWESAKWGIISLRSNLCYTSSQLSPIVGAGKDIMIGGIGVKMPDNEINRRILWNGGIGYEKSKFNIEAQCYNILDYRYSQGGTTIVPYVQPGRWFTCKISYKY